MITEESLTKCIDYLAEINANLSNNALRRMVLEVGYILKQELDNVTTWNKQFGENKKPTNIDVRKLIEDNTQLFNENRKLHEANLKLKDVIDGKIPHLESTINSLNSRINTFSEILAK